LSPGRPRDNNVAMVSEDERHVSSSSPPPENAALLALVQAIGRVRAGGEGASLAVVEREMSVGSMSALHVHESDEAFYVVEGAMTVHAGRESVRLERDDSFVVAKGVPHTYRADSKRVRYLAVAFVGSSADYGDFLRAVSRPQPTASGAPSWPSADDVPRLEAMAAPNATTILGPPGLLPSALA
jgi:mannose-6-phosphate isomerase-like protein (cupin superfamily)